jgi:hypothetical protein
MEIQTKRKKRMKAAMIVMATIPSSSNASSCSTLSDTVCYILLPYGPDPRVPKINPEHAS